MSCRGARPQSDRTPRCNPYLFPSEQDPARGVDGPTQPPLTAPRTGPVGAPVSGCGPGSRIRFSQRGDPAHLMGLPQIKAQRLGWDQDWSCQPECP